MSKLVQTDVFGVKIKPPPTRVSTCLKDAMDDELLADDLSMARKAWLETLAQVPEDLRQAFTEDATCYLRVQGWRAEEHRLRNFQWFLRHRPNELAAELC